MSTPQDPRSDGQAGSYNPYAQPGQESYRAGQQPGQYTSSPLPGQGHQPYPGQGQPPYAGYDPYGGSAQAGYGTSGHGGPVAEPVKRPGLMVLSLVLMILAALPFLLGGVVGLFALTPSDIPPELLSNPGLAQTGATPELLIQAAQLVLGAVVVVALVYLAFAIFAFRGRNWARIIVTVLTVGFVLLLLAGLAGGANAGGLLAFVVVLVVVMIASVVIMFLPGSQRFFSSPRR